MIDANSRQAELASKRCADRQKLGIAGIVRIVRLF